MSNHIEIFMYSYKNKNLLTIVKNLYETSTYDNFSITLVDQNNVNRKSDFFNFEGMSYKFVKWDMQKSPCKYKADFIRQAQDNFVLIVSDDVFFSPGWDKILVDFVSQNNVVVSGNAVASIYQKDLFFIDNSPVFKENFALSQYIDRQLIFAQSELIRSVTYPGQLKYNGEQEVYSIHLLAHEIDIYSGPEKLYKDMGIRTIENLYLPFSKDHNYGRVYQKLNHAVSSKFVSYHKIDVSSIKPLPDYNNDVEYSQDDLKFASTSGSKFIDVPNKID